MQSQSSTQSSLGTGSVSSAMLQQRRVSLAAARLTPSSDTGDMGSADDDVVRYGSVVRLWAASQYARGGQGGYVGYYRKSVTGGGRQKRRNGGPFVAIPPFDAIRQEQYTPSCFQVVDPKRQAVEGTPLRYGDEVTLVDDQGMAWNNMQGPISYLGPGPLGSNGQMNLKLVRESTAYGNLDARLELLDAAVTDDDDDENGPGPSTTSPTRRRSSFEKRTAAMAATADGSGNDSSLPANSSAARSASLPTDDAAANEGNTTFVRYGDFDVKLDVVNVKRVLLKKKYTNYITNFKKDVSKLQGGYLVCDGRGRPASFSIHHAPPQVDKATLYRPNTTATLSQSFTTTNAAALNNNGNNNGSSSGSSGSGRSGDSPRAGSQRKKPARRDSVATLRKLTPAASLLVDNHAAQIHYDLPWHTSIQFVLEKYTPPPLTPASSSPASTQGSNANRSRRGTYVIGTGDGAPVQTASGEGDLSPLVVGSSANHTCSSSSPPGSPREVNASQDGSSSSGLAVPHDPVVRLVLSNGGRATIYRDEIEHQLALAANSLKKGNSKGNKADSFKGNGDDDEDGEDGDEEDDDNEACSFWVDLLDREEEDRRYQQSLDAVLFGFSSSTTPSTPVAGGASSSSSDFSSLPASPSLPAPAAPFSPTLLSPRSKAQAPVTSTGAIHIACRRLSSNGSLEDEGDGSKEIHSFGRQSSFRASTAAAAGTTGSATTIGGGGGSASAAGSASSHGLGGRSGNSKERKSWSRFLIRLPALTWPWVVRGVFWCAFAQLVYRAGGFFLWPYLGAPSGLVEDFATFESELYEVRAQLVEAMHLRSPLRVLVALITCATSKLQALLKSSEASALLAQPLALCGGSAYLAAHAGFLLGAPLYELLMSVVGLILRAAGLRTWFGLSEPLDHEELASNDNDVNSYSSSSSARRVHKLQGLGAGPWGHGKLWRSNSRKQNGANRGLTPSSSAADGNGSGHFGDEFVASGDVERWELTLMGWELASAAALNRALLAKKKMDHGDDDDSNASEANAEEAAPFLPERFLLAEAGDYAKGLQRYHDTLAWRAMKDADHALEKPHKFFALVKECYPHCFHGTDKAGNVVYYELPGQCDFNRIKRAGVDKDSFADHIMYVQEYLWTVLQPRQEDRVTLVLDLGALTMGTIMNKEVVAIIKGVVNMTSTHYPQRSHKMLILNVPGWFGFLFNIVKPLLNDAQKAKINIFRAHEVLEGMRSVIDDDQIPLEYGGSCQVALGHMESEQAMRRQVFKNLSSSGTELVTDKEMKNPDGSPATLEQWVYTPSVP